MRVHIRGSMGVQIMQAFAALSKVDKRETPIMYVNTLGMKEYRAMEKLSGIFDCQFQVLLQDEIRKTPYWEPGCASRIFQHRERILKKWMNPILFEPREHTEIALYVEQGKAISDENYVRYAELAKNDGAVTVFSDAPLSVEIPGTTSSNKGEVEDWRGLFTSPVIYCGPSIFAITTLLIDPTVYINVAGPSWCIDSTSAANDYAFIEEAQEFCPNLNIIQYA